MVQASQPTIHRYTHSDGYVTHYRRWGPPSGPDAILLLHGAMSHSGWQAPLGTELAAISEVALVASDRRGSGLNEDRRGDAESAQRIIDDVVEQVRFLKGSFDRVHLAGWCFGGQVAWLAAARLAEQREISTLLLIAPAFFFGERYGDVLRRSTDSVFEVVRHFELVAEPAHAFVPLPLRPDDFTSDPRWQEFIGNDALSVTKVTARAMRAGAEIAERALKESPPAGAVRVLAVLGERDRLIDNDRVRQFLLEHNESEAPVIDTVDAGHAVQFEQPERLARCLAAFLSASGKASPATRSA